MKVLCKSIIIITFHLLIGKAGAQDFVLGEVLVQDTSKIMRKILADPDKYKVQIIYTKIDRDSSNRPKSYRQYFRYKPEEFFYLASMVKLPCAAFSLEKIHKLKIKGVERYTPFKILSNYMCYANSKYKRYETPTSLTQWIRKLFVLSDNIAYNQLYEFLGQEYIHKRFEEMGYDSARVIQKFSPCTPDQCRTTGPIIFYQKGKPFHTLPQQTFKDTLSVPLANTVLGGKHIQGRKLVKQGKDYKYSNYISLGTLTDFIFSIMIPEMMPPEKRFQLDNSDYNILRTSMGMYPRELSNTYTKQMFPDSHMKYLLLGNDKVKADSNIRIFNKVGMYYGYMTDCAYIVDYAKGIEFGLSAILYVNEDDIINDHDYEYDTIGYPFFKRLGELIYQEELKRYKRHLPKLEKLNFSP